MRHSEVCNMPNFCYYQTIWSSNSSILLPRQQVQLLYFLMLKSCLMTMVNDSFLNTFQSMITLKYIPKKARIDTTKSYHCPYTSCAQSQLPLPHDISTMPGDNTTKLLPAPIPKALQAQLLPPDLSP